ncbi:MAG: tRNA glutamyl-Q(34) synthetase GluQRS [Burkholderiaceae bacterium]
MNNHNANYVGRFAPSPSGPLHAGSVATALGSWLDAQAHGGRWLVRIEDLDTPRVAPGAARGILHDLQQLGLHWDGEVVRQSARTALYEAALKRLTAADLTYPCACTRREIADSQAAAGVLNTDVGAVYPGTCANGLAAGKTARAVRFRVPTDVVEWTDRAFPETPAREHLPTACGDFVVHRADGFWAYQLAVVVDDAAQSVTDVVRGADLASSTARQIALQRALGLLTPRYWHLPLVYGGDGNKLSKQNGAAPIDTRQAIAALNAAAQHLGMLPITANTPAEWLARGVAAWKDLL